MPDPLDVDVEKTEGELFLSEARRFFDHVSSEGTQRFQAMDLSHLLIAFQIWKVVNVLEAVGFRFEPVGDQAQDDD